MDRPKIPRFYGHPYRNRTTLEGVIHFLRTGFADFLTLTCAVLSHANTGGKVFSGMHHSVPWPDEGRFHSLSYSEYGHGLAEHRVYMHIAYWGTVSAQGWLLGY